MKEKSVHSKKGDDEKMYNCPFCKIDQTRNVIVEEKKLIFVTYSNPRLMPGHILVIPKRHVEKISELNKKEMIQLFQTVAEYQDKITETVADGCDVRHHYRPFQKESNLKVHHLHVHLQPRNLYDELYLECQLFETKLFKEVSIDKIRFVK